MQSALSRLVRSVSPKKSIPVGAAHFFPATAPAFSTTTARWLSSATDEPLCDKLAFIGTGKMAQAMIRPLVNKGYQPPEQIAIYDLSTSAIRDMKNEFDGIQAAESIEDLVTDADLIVCAVKPQNINASFWEQFPAQMRDDATFVSILAGTSIQEFRPSGVSKIVRAMPNTPAQIGEGMTVWCCTPTLTAGERKNVEKVLNTFGESV